MDILTISSINLLLGLCLFLLLFIQSKTSALPPHFMVFSFAGLCLMLNSMIGISHSLVALPIYLMPALANAATVALHAVVLAGLLTLCRVRFSLAVLLLPVLISFSLSFFEPFKTAMPLRLAANFGLIILLNALSFRVLRSIRQPSQALLLFKVILVFNIIQLLLRAVFYLLYELNMLQLAQHLFIHQIGWFAFTLYCSGVLASCLLMLAEKKQQELELKANTDALTGLLNRNELMSSINKELNRCVRQQQSMTVMMLDVDYFKRINDTYGHITGDVAIQHVAAVLRQHFRNYDLLFRMGGEEFLACLPGVDAAQAKVKLEQLRQEFLQRPLVVDDEINITVSMGWVATRQEVDVTALLRCADDALYQAKKQGRNQVLQAVL